MGRPRKWESDADRKRAIRNAPPAESAIEAADALASATTTEPELVALPKYRPAPDLGLYVREAREAARLDAEARAARYASSGAAGVEAAIDIEARVDAAERYARWRWQGYRDGQIVRL